MMSKLSQRFRKRQFYALALFGFSIFGASIFQHYFYNSENEPFPNITFLQNDNITSETILLSDFNPNELNAEQWKAIGFSDKQVHTILKYKEVVGGEFTSKEQLKKCYAISEKKYREIKSYILLPETASNHYFSDYEPNAFEKRSLKILGKFNPDHLSETDWTKMGFSQKQSAAIMKYKDYLGGSFVSKEKFKECFIISSENYAQLSPFLLLPEKTPISANINSFKENPKIQYTVFDPNLLDFEGWKNLGFSDKQTNVILNYKNRNLNGSFKSMEDVQKCFVISTDKFEELKPFIKLNPQNVTINPKVESTKNYTTTIPKIKTDFTNIDLNQITFQQLREFGFTEKTAGSFVGFRKSLGGFVNKNQVYETFGIDRDLTEKLVNQATLNASTVQKFTLLTAPESWLKTHPYFKYSADKIIYYRISNPDEKKIWKFIKTKPEYQEKMLLYLK